MDVESTTSSNNGTTVLIYFLRPKLEYASPVWHGNLLERDAVAIERVQAAVPAPSFAPPSVHLRRTCLRRLGTVLGRKKCANFFVKTYCLWHKQLENEIILGVTVLHFSENGSEHCYFRPSEVWSEWENGDLLAFRQQF